MYKKQKTEIIQVVAEKFDGLKEDLLILVGSRALKQHRKDSDIDTIVLTTNSSSYRRKLLDQKIIQKHEDVRFSQTLSTNLTLEVKVLEYNSNNLNITTINSIINAKPIYNFKKLTAIKKELRAQYKSIYKELLMLSYINFYNELKQLEGILNSKEEDLKYTILMNKGVVLRMLLRLILTIQNQPYPSDKWLLVYAKNSKLGKGSNELTKDIYSINTTEEYKEFKKKVNTFLTENMPKEPYVGIWWKYLDFLNKSPIKHLM